MFTNTYTIESYARLISGGHADLDLGPDGRATVASLLEAAVERAIDFGHVDNHGNVSRNVLARMLDRDDVSGDVWGPHLGRAKVIVENV